MHELFVDVNGMPTHLMTWGPWIEESFSKKEVVICITGNPGLPGFYTQFMSTIHEQMGPDLPVWLIGHAGHDEPPPKSKKQIPLLVGNEEKFGLEAQIQHKIEFIRQYVPEDVKIHLIGHSIGAWMVLRLLKIAEIKEKIQHCYLLFPTIERMAKSSNGFWFTKIVQPLWFLIYYIYLLFNVLPVFLQVFILSIYFFIMSIPKTYLGTALKYSRLSITEKVIYLANEEMEIVRDADYETIRANKQLIKFYYGANDGWTPLKYVKDLRDNVKDCDADIDIHGINHAFVLHSSEKMGKILCDWIRQYKR